MKSMSIFLRLDAESDLALDRSVESSFCCQNRLYALESTLDRGFSRVHALGVSIEPPIALERPLSEFSIEKVVSLTIFRLLSTQSSLYSAILRWRVSFCSTKRSKARKACFFPKIAL